MKTFSWCRINCPLSAFRPFSTRAKSAALASSKYLNSQSAIKKELKPIAQNLFYSQSNCRKEAPFFERCASLKRPLYMSDLERFHCVKIKKF